MKILLEEKFKTVSNEYFLICVATEDVPYCLYDESRESLIKKLSNKAAEICDMCEGEGEIDTYSGECSDPDCCGYYPDDYEWVQTCSWCFGSGLMKDQEDYNETD